MPHQINKNTSPIPTCIQYGQTVSLRRCPI